jgi:Flp pilus assembly pilin Flp
MAHFASQLFASTVRGQRASRQRAQGLIEYTLVLVLIAVVIIGGMLAVAGQLQNVYGDVISALQGSA